MHKSKRGSTLVGSENPFSRTLGLAYILHVKWEVQGFAMETNRGKLRESRSRQVIPGPQCCGRALRTPGEIFGTSINRKSGEARAEAHFVRGGLPP